MMRTSLSAVWLAAGLTAGAAGMSWAKESVILTVTPSDARTGARLPGAQIGEREFSTLPAAIEAARQVRRSGGTNTEVTILLRAGQHRLAAPLELTPEDSELTIGAAPGERPVITSARRITAWAPVAGQSNAWATMLPSVGDKWYFRSLFVAGQRAQRARTPNAGYFHMAGERFSDDPVRFHFQPGDIRPEWAHDPDAEVVGLEKWTTFRQHLRDVNEASNVVTLSSHAASHTREKNAQYYVENVASALDAPGEWHLDRSSGVLTYLARPGEDLRWTEVTAPTLTQLIRFVGDAAAQHPVRHVTLRGLTFAGTDWSLPPQGRVDVQAAVAAPGSVSAEGAVDCVIENCVFERLGGYALDLGRGCQRDRVSGCRFTDLDAGAVRIGETTARTGAADQNFGHLILDNEMAALGRVSASAVGVLVLQSGQNRIAHNHIHDLYYTAISVGWTWGYRESPCRENIVEFNHLHDVGQGMLSDMGGIYTLGPQPGTVLRNNLIHDVVSYGYGGWGLYTDEGSTGLVLESNVVYRCKSAGFHQHYGRENIVRNNIFALNTEHELMRTRVEPHCSFFLTNNLIYFNTGDLLGSNWSGTNYVLDGNCYYDTRLGTNQGALRFAGQGWAQWRQAGRDAHSLLADPLFVAPDQLDFRLRPESPAYKLGFHPIDLRTVGVRQPQ